MQVKYAVDSIGSKDKHECMNCPTNLGLNFKFLFLTFQIVAVKITVSASAIVLVLNRSKMKFSRMVRPSAS